MISEFFIFAGFISFLAIAAYGFFQWLEKIELETEYLSNIIQEQKKNSNTIKKGLM